MSGIEIKNRWTGAVIATGREGETVFDARLLARPAG